MLTHLDETSIECLINRWIDWESNDWEIIKFLIFLLKIGILFCDPNDDFLKPESVYFNQMDENLQ